MKTSRWPRLVMIAVLFATVAACAGTETAGGPADPVGAGPTRETAVAPPNADQSIRLSKEDLAGRLGISVGDITLVRAEGATWADTSLGCPVPGVVYAQVIVPGYRIELLAGSDSYVYHSDLHELVVLCEGEGAQPMPLTPGPGDIKDDQPWMPVY